MATGEVGGDPVEDVGFTHAHHYDQLMGAGPAADLVCYPENGPITGQLTMQMSRLGNSTGTRRCTGPRTSAIDLAPDEPLDRLAGLGVGVLDRWRLHEVAGRGDQRSADPPV